MLLPLALSCARSMPPPDPGAVCPDDPGLVDGLPPPEVVVLISIDTVNRDFLGVHHPTWDTTPRLDALFAESARLDHVIVPRGLSGVSMASMVTGAYPRTHGVRDNDHLLGDDPVSADTPTLGERFAEAGYRTFGFSSNMCFLLDPTMSATACNWDDPTLDQAEGDAALVEGFLETLDAEPAAPFFLWIHFMDPHDPYTRRDPWYAEFHSAPYDGPLVDASEAELAKVMSGELPYTDADRAHVEAIYASQLRATDALVAALLDGLDTRGLYDDAVIAFAIDHGDELARRTRYFYHGCSPYDGVVDVTWAIRASGRVPAGEVLAGRVSAVDFAPTILDVAGLEWTGEGEGISLLPELRACVEPDRVAFFERGKETAGIVDGRWKYFLDPRGGYEQCKHYDGANPFPNEVEELYDLDADSLELDNRVTTDRDVARRLRGQVCSWVNDGVWGVGEGFGAGNTLLEACAR